jgi:hypothetical protein
MAESASALGACAIAFRRMELDRADLDRHLPVDPGLSL